MRIPRRLGGRGGERGGGGRDTSPPPTKARDHKRSEWRPNSYRSRRSLSPPIRDHPRRLSPSRGRRSTSIERRDYASTLSRRSDYGKQQQQQKHDQTPPLLPSQSHGNCPTLAFGDEGSGGYENFRRKYRLDDPPSDLYPESDPKSYQALKSKDFHLHHVPNGGGASSSSGGGLDGQGMLVQKSMHLDDGSFRTFFTLPPEQGNHLSDAAALNSKSSGSTFRLGLHGNEELRYHERMRETYDEGEKQQMYSRDLPYPMMPPSQSKAFLGSSSSGLLKDDVLGSYRDSLRLSPDGFGRSSDVSKFRDNPLGNDGYSQVQLFDPVKRGPLSLPVRDEPQGYSYSELGQRVRSEREFLASDYPYKKMPWVPRGDFRETLGSSFVDSLGGKLGKTESSPNKVTKEASLWDCHPSLVGDAELDYCDMKRVHEEYLSGSGNGPVGFGTNSSHDREFAHVGERYDYWRDAAPVGYRERSKSPLSDRYVDIYRWEVSPPRGRESAEDMNIYDPLSERMMKSNYIIDDNMNASDSGSMLPNSWNASGRIRESSVGDELWTSKDRVGPFPSKRLGFRRPQYKTLSRRVSGSGAWLRSRDLSIRSQGVRDIKLKKQLRPGYSNYHGSLLLDRRQDFYRPYKFFKNPAEDRNAVMKVHDEDVLEDDTLLVKRDPPEDSEEFKQQVHKAFLRFSKILNESAHQKKRYREQGKASSLRCCVCGSTSKEFVETHSLVAHSFNSLRVGLRTDHLGLHKALCVLMGWNWQVPPDNGRVYQSQPIAEAKALKEDLILWPPVVIIHNSSIGSKNTKVGPNVVSNEDMVGILRGMGFEAGKTRVCRGKPANQSVLLVKFTPTFSGLQEAERLHKHYSDNSHGRKEFQEITSNNGSSGNRLEETSVFMEQLLYGYMGTADDLDKLDIETKKRCLVKSKKDIEAIADAAVATE